MDPKIDNLGMLRRFVLGIVVSGAFGSLYLTALAGERNKSLILVFLFIVWTLSAFAALIWINILSKSWPHTPRIISYVFMLIVTVGSLILYSGIYRVQGAKNAFVFLVTPLVTWLMIAIGYIVFRFRKFA
jgi:hypothetical protein